MVFDSPFIHFPIKHDDDEKRIHKTVDFALHCTQWKFNFVFLCTSYKVEEIYFALLCANRVRSVRWEVTSGTGTYSEHSQPMMNICKRELGWMLISCARLMDICAKIAVLFFHFPSLLASSNLNSWTDMKYSFVSCIKHHWQ